MKRLLLSLSCALVAFVTAAADCCTEYARTVKMTYKPKTGVFKGKLKVAFGPYCMEAGPGMRLPKGKTATFSVTGYRIDGRLYGNAKYKTFSTSVWGE